MMIEVNDVTLKTKEYTILDHVSVTVKRGETVGLVGGNGSGKPCS